tara:strand:+ start:9997 stop:10557 length:561 start_codon:yes stop_codon:yes gene_type:complete
MMRIGLVALVMLAVMPSIGYAASAGIEASNNCYDQFRSGNMNAAINYCTAAIESGDLDNDELVGALINRGVAFRNIKEFERAVVDYTAALKLAPGDAMIYANRANARRELGELKKALGDANNAIKLDGERAASFYTRGAVYEAASQLDNARKDYAMAFSLAPDNVDYRNAVSQVEAKLAQVNGGQP